MPTPEPITVGSTGLMADPVVQADGSVRLKAGGKTYAVAGFDDAVTQVVEDLEAATAPVSRITSSASSVTLLAANTSTDASTSRKGVSIYNESTQVLYVHLGATAATAANYWLAMAANSYAEVPFRYKGEIRGIWASANGFANVSEFV